MCTLFLLFLILIYFAVGGILLYSGIANYAWDCDTVEEDCQVAKNAALGLTIAGGVVVGVPCVLLPVLFLAALDKSGSNHKTHQYGLGYDSMWAWLRCFEPCFTCCPGPSSACPCCGIQRQQSSWDAQTEETNPNPEKNPQAALAAVL